MPRTARHAAGFSLLELVIVLALVGIVSAIAIPKYSSSLDNYRASFAARKIAADLAMAQNTARSVSASRTVTFGANNRWYGVSSVGALDRATGAYAVDLSVDPYRASVKVDIGGAAQITFDGYGHPDSAGSIEVHSGQAKRSISIDGQSGNCTIQ